MIRGRNMGLWVGGCWLLAQVAWAQDIASLPSADSKPGEEIEEVSEVRQLPANGAWNPEMFPVLDRVSNLLTPSPQRRRSLVFTIDHRPFQRLTRQTFRDWFGFDAGALKVGLGLRLGLLDGLDVGVARLNGTGEIFDVYQFDARYRLLAQSRAFCNLAVRAGITWFYQPDFEDASGYFAEWLLDRAFFGRLTVGAGLSFHSSSSGATKSNQDTKPSLAVLAWTEVRLLSFLAWNLEMAAPVAGFRQTYPALTTALKFLSHRHTFSLLLSNTQYISVDGLAAGSNRDLGDLIFGFTILREFEL